MSIRDLFEIASRQTLAVNRANSNEYLNNMKSSLASSQKPYDTGRIKLAAMQLLDEAAVLFEKAGLSKKAEEITNVMGEISGDILDADVESFEDE